ncbi:hypothetical protein [Isoptericola cucumis]|uniref:hypothetical protein n=1 Tax=Isoptericola cucumis TaxID=1776856 RepID=UPI001667BA66|nr:hypothetical protein [Isoptericola cucumis]
MGTTRTRRDERRRRAPRGLRRPLPPGWSRPAPLAASGAVSLLLGVAVGLGSGVLGDAGGAAASGEASAAVPVEPATCAEAQVAWSRAATAQVAMSADQPRTLRTGFTRARDALAAVRPPEPVVADWQVVLDYLSTVATAVEKADGDDDVPGAVAGALESLDTPAMSAASDRVTTYLRDDCGASSDGAADDAGDDAGDGAEDDPAGGS